LARRLGATADQIAAMAGGDLTSFDESWQIALYVADRSTNNRGTIEPEVYADLALHWNPGQIIEIIAVIGLFNYFNRFAIGLDIPPTK
jgi:alkylhydroperoxidase family enzyme